MNNNLGAIFKTAAAVGEDFSAVYTALMFGNGEDVHTAAETLRDTAAGFGFDAAAYDRPALPEKVPSLHIGVIIPEEPASYQKSLTEGFQKVIAEHGLPIRMSYRFLPPDSVIENRVYTEEFFRMINEMNRERVDVFVIYPLKSSRCFECLREISQRRPVIVFDNYITAKGFGMLEDAAIVGREHFETGRLAAMLRTNYTRKSYFVSVVTYQEDDLYTFDSPMTNGFRYGVNELRRFHDPDCSVMRVPGEIRKVANFLAGELETYYHNRTETMREILRDDAEAVHGLGLVYTHPGLLEPTLQALQELNRQFDPFFRRTLCVGSDLFAETAAHPNMLADLSLSVADLCTTVLSVACERMTNGRFPRHEYWLPNRIIRNP